MLMLLLLFLNLWLLLLFVSVTLSSNMFISKDPQLTGLAKLLDKSDFSIPTSQTHIDEVKEIYHLNRRFRFCYPGIGGTGWAVRISMNGYQRLIGVSVNCAQAVRFADVATLRFWKYRKNILRSPVDLDFNLGLKRAEQESSTESPAIILLTQIETHCRTQGYLSFPSDNKSSPGLKTRKKWLVAWDKFKQCSKEISETCSVLDEVGTYAEVLNVGLEEFEKTLFSVDKFLKEKNVR